MIQSRLYNFSSLLRNLHLCWPLFHIFSVNITSNVILLKCKYDHLSLWHKNAPMASSGTQSKNQCTFYDLHRSTWSDLPYLCGVISYNSLPHSLRSSNPRLFAFFPQKCQVCASSMAFAFLFPLPGLSTLQKSTWLVLPFSSGLHLKSPSQWG